MRLTSSVQAVHKGFWFKQSWKKKCSKFTVQSVSVPEPIRAKGIVPVNPLEDWNASKEKKVWIPPNDSRFMFPPAPEDHKDWHEEEAHTFNTDMRLWEGVRQAQILTNSVVHHELPSRITERIDKDRHPEQDHLMQRDILNAHLWDTTRKKLPVREKPADISLISYKAEIGIPVQRYQSTLLNSIAHRCSQLASLRNPTLGLSRKLVSNHQLYTSYTFEDKPIYLNSKSDILLTSTQPLERFASTGEVQQTANEHVMDIFPIAATVDLDKTHIYRTAESLGYSASYSHKHHHTLLLNYNSEWTMDQRHANAILMSYAHCHLIARSVAGKNLACDPVSVQTIHTDGISFGYTCFQLNTLNVADTSCRNIAWVDDDRLFEKIIPRRAMLRNTKYRNYNPDVAKKILSLWFS